MDWSDAELVEIEKIKNATDDEITGGEESLVQLDEAISKNLEEDAIHVKVLQSILDEVDQKILDFIDTLPTSKEGTLTAGTWSVDYVSMISTDLTLSHPMNFPLDLKYSDGSYALQNAEVREDSNNLLWPIGESLPDGTYGLYFYYKDPFTIHVKYNDVGATGETDEGVHYVQNTPELPSTFLSPVTWGHYYETGVSEWWDTTKYSTPTEQEDQKLIEQEYFPVIQAIMTHSGGEDSIPIAEPDVRKNIENWCVYIENHDGSRPAEATPGNIDGDIIKGVSQMSSVDQDWFAGKLDFYDGVRKSREHIDNGTRFKQLFSEYAKILVQKDIDYAIEKKETLENYTN